VVLEIGKSPVQRNRGGIAQHRLEKKDGARAGATWLRPELGTGSLTTW
jgi:hypothetical protein